MGKRTTWEPFTLLDESLDAIIKDGRDGWKKNMKKKKVQPVIEVQAVPVHEVQSEPVLEDQAEPVLEDQAETASETALATPLARAEMSSSKPSTPHGELPVSSLASVLSLSPLSPVLSPSILLLDAYLVS